MKTLGDELRWTFTWPFGWLQGVLVNLVLAAAYLVFWPLAVNEHYDIVLLFSVYFATFIMADVTTTNIFGHDIVRMLRALDQGRSFLSLILLKNLVQTIVVVIPMLLITIGVTYVVRGSGELVLAIPGILYPMLLWLGVGQYYFGGISSNSSAYTVAYTKCSSRGASLEAPCALGDFLCGAVGDLCDYFIYGYSG